jgi:small subunit ribosomal protein S17
MADTGPDGGAEELAPVEDAPVVAAPAGTVKAPATAEQAPPAAAASKPAPPTATARSGAAVPVTEPRGRRKVREGIVASNAMDKTAIVLVVERVRHARYAKTVQRTKRLYAHDEANDVKVGDRVRLTETRPLSKLKRWRVEQVLERAR